MENEFVKLMELIMECLAKDEYKSFYYYQDKFHFIDKERNINFEATFGNSNYYLKDNISDSTYIATRKNLGDGVFIYQIIMSTPGSKYYSSFFLKGYMMGLIKLISVNEKSSIVCNNPDCIDRIKDDDDLREYIEAFFSEELSDDEEELEDVADNIEENTEYEEKTEDNTNPELNPAEKSMLDIEPPEIDGFDLEVQVHDTDDYTHYSDIYAEDEDIDDDDEILKNAFEVIVDGHEVTGKPKVAIIEDCALELTNRQYYLQDIEIFAENLKLLLEDIKKDIEHDL